MDPSLYGDYPEQTGFLAILNRLMSIAIVIVFCIGGAIAFIPLLRQNSNVAADIKRLQADLTYAKAEHTRLLKEKELLQNNPEYVEVEARDRLNMMKPGEVIIRFEGLPTRGSAPVAPATPGAPVISEAGAE